MVRKFYLEKDFLDASLSGRILQERLMRDIAEGGQQSSAKLAERSPHYGDG